MMEIDWSDEWNFRLLAVLNRTSIVEIGLLASHDVQSALDYEKRLADCEKQIKLPLYR